MTGQEENYTLHVENDDRFDDVNGKLFYNDDVEIKCHTRHEVMVTPTLIPTLIFTIIPTRTHPILLHAPTLSG